MFIEGVTMLLLYPVVCVFCTFLQSPLQTLAEAPSSAESMNRLTRVLQLVRRQERLQGQQVTLQRLS